MNILKSIFFILISISTYGQNVEQNNKSNVNENTKMDAIDYNPEIARVHPKAKELMNEEFFFSPIDATGPFGSDDASDTYVSFAEWKSENKTKSPKIFLLQHIEDWGYPLFDLTTTDFDLLKPYIEKSNMHIQFLTGIDQAIIAVAFGKLYLDGEIDNQVIIMTEDALVRQLNPKLISMWPDDYEKERKDKLTKMLEIIKKLK